MHQDLHPDNVLAAEREPWLVIDPKPLVGEREFAVAPIVRASELGHSRRAVIERLDRLTSELGLDRERARGWTIGQTIAWGVDSEFRRHARRDRSLALGGGSMTLTGVLFDVDFTLVKPGPDLGPEGYQALGRRFGLELDPSRYADARAGAVAAVERHPELDHDEEVWVLFTERIVRGMGGDSERAYECAVETTRAWEHAENFDLYEDTLPVLGALREHGLKIGLVSNTGRDLAAFVAHHALDVDAAVGSGTHGKTKPHPAIFLSALGELGIRAEEAGDGRRLARG